MAKVLESNSFRPLVLLALNRELQPQHLVNIAWVSHGCKGPMPWRPLRSFGWPTQRSGSKLPGA